jgi:serine protease Do
LAVIKIEAPQPMQTMNIGTSSDLMTGEEVIAIGNAYGYEHTVTRGIVSALHRTVEVGEGQEYADLIQTDASINPGNSGGPLLNIDGDLIGINVAVRVGAQGIGFAVPIDRALDVAAHLMDTEVRKTVTHGVEGKTIASPQKSEFLVTGVASGSAAEIAGVLPGDVVVDVAGVAVSRALDFERTLLDKRAGDELQLTVRRGGESHKLSLVLSNASVSERSVSELAWDVFGIRLTPTASSTFRRISTRYRGGLKVIGVRSDSPAAQQGIRYGDILVGMHKWETVSMDNVAFILESDVVRGNEPVKFYVLRGSETLFGHLQVSMRNQ